MRMKTAVLPQVRVAPQLRSELEDVLREGESLSGFVVASVRSAVEYRRLQDAFFARGELARQAFDRSGVAHSVDTAMAELHAQLDVRRKQLKPRPKA